MSRMSRNLCFAICVAVGNILFYLVMSGSLVAFKKKEPVEQSGRTHHLRAEMFEDEISKLVKSAVRDHGMSRQNLSMMLENAYREHEAEEDRKRKNNDQDLTMALEHAYRGHATSERNSMDDFFIHKGKSVSTKRTSDTAMLHNNKSREEKPKYEMTIEDLAPIHSVEKELEPLDVGKVEEVQFPAERNDKGGVLDVIGQMFGGGGKKEKPIVFPHDYNLVLNEPNKCKNSDGSDKPTFFLVLVMSIHKNFDQRNAIRRTWGSPTEINGKQIVTLFLLAKSTNSKHQSLVEQESKRYKDILMEDFMDTYKNLTIKTMMGMKWASIYCPHANYIMKTDDDMYIQYANIVPHLSKPITPTSNYVSGFVINGSPIRDPKSKWYMPKETYPGTKYPPFCSGTGYMFSGDVAGKVYETSLHTPFLYLEDVFFAICIHSLQIVPINHKGFNNWRTPYSYCKYKRIFTTHMVPPTEMRRIWDDQKTEKGYKCYI
ncbi:beta-1,3-galactosyltransferase 1-like [Lytechinus pictus]|uniref:beta-1,3-galactosyltransferase 1-like n=1 Tax=Lytechinus pictus TaxID=7653 RepID=UPI0030B9B528